MSYLIFFFFSIVFEDIKKRVHIKQSKMTTTKCGLIGGVFELFHLVSSFSDNSKKIPVVHMILSIIVMWCRVNEFTTETHFYIQKKKRKKKRRKEEAKCLKIQHATRRFLIHISIQNQGLMNMTNNEVHSNFLSLGLN